MERIAKNYDISLVGVAEAGSDKVTFINKTKSSEALKTAGLDSQRYMHLTIKEPVQVVDGYKTTAGLLKPKTVIIFENSHKAVFDMIQEEIDAKNYEIPESNKLKMKLNGVRLSGLLLQKIVPFDYKLYTIKDGNIQYLTSTSRTVDIDSGKVSYSTGPATSNKIELFVHAQDLDIADGLLAKEEKTASAFAVKGTVKVAEESAIEKETPAPEAETPAPAQPVAAAPAPEAVPEPVL